MRIVADTSNSFVVHLNPVWKRQANFVINAELRPDDLPKTLEQLWVRQVSEDQFEVCCIPFFIYDCALGDIVKTVARAGRQYVPESVVHSSGRSTFRVWFGESRQPRADVASALEEMGCTLEWSSHNLLAVDAANDAMAQIVADFLWKSEQQGDLQYETGRLA